MHPFIQALLSKKQSRTQALCTEVAQLFGVLLLWYSERKQSNAEQDDPTRSGPTLFPAPEGGGDLPAGYNTSHPLSTIRGFVWLAQLAALARSDFAGPPSSRSMASRSSVSPCESQP